MRQLRQRAIIVAALGFGVSTALAGTLTGDCEGWQVSATSHFSFAFTISVTAELADAVSGEVIASSSDSTSMPAGGGPWSVGNTWPGVVPEGNYVINAVEEITNDDTGQLALVFEHQFPGDGTALGCDGSPNQGCTPGYWKQPHHFVDWTAPYTPETLFGDVFEDVQPGKTLLTILSQPASTPPGPNLINILSRHAVAALLNAASPDVTYPLTPGRVIKLFGMAVPGGDVEGLKDEFEMLNEQVCPLNGDSDVDSDGLVGISDLLEVLNYWGTVASHPDVDNDGVVGIGDLLVILSSWGS